ncbi:MAG: hypothetical protein ACRDQW_08240, partial [Haloechinothrix sp.]
MMTEPRPPELKPPGDPVPCRHCCHPIVDTVLGWIHVDARREPTSWLCPDEDTLAAPGLIGPETADPPSPKPAQKSRPRPTPIPPRPEVGQAGTTPRPAPPV